MGWLVDRLAEPWQLDLVVRAMIAALLVGATGGALGTFVVLRGLSFTGEAFAHTAFPGAVIALLLGGSVVAGGVAVALLSAAAIALAGRVARTPPDTAVGVVFVGAFAVGAVLLSTSSSHAVDLESFLFGRLLGVSWTDVAVTGVVGAVAVAGLAAMWRPLVMTTFDRAAAAGAGVRPARVDMAFLLLLALAVVAAIQAVGSVLALAMLVTPAATARLLTRRLAPTVILAAALGAAEGVAGLYVSWYGGVAAGGAVVLVATGVFALALLASPRAGPVAWLRRRQAVVASP